MTDTPTPEAAAIRELTDKHVIAAQTLRAAIWTIAQELSPQNPTRGRLMEALFAFQLGAPVEFLP